MTSPTLPILGDLAVIFAVAVATVALLSRLGLPSVVGFLVAGALIGPGGLGLVTSPARIEVLAEIGVVVLLFVIGTEFSLARLAALGRYVLVGGGLQVGLTVLVAAALLTARGAPVRSAVFWGYLAALSSTAIVLRALDERGEVETPHGRIIVGMLIFQDLCVVPMMLSLPLLAARELAPLTVLGVLARAAAVLAAVFLLGRWAIPPLLGRLAALRRREVFLLAVVAVALLVALVTARMGLSLALGGFCGGVILADSPYVYQAQSELVPFRDAFASLFFVSVGMLIDPAAIAAAPAPVLGWFVALLGGKLVLATLAALLLRVPTRVAVQVGFAIAQVGEFSFALLRVGETSGLVDAEGARHFLAASVLTMMVAPLLLAAGPRVGLAAGRAFAAIDRLTGARTVAGVGAEELRDHVIVAGLGLGGRTLLRALEVAGVPHVALDLDPEKVREERAAGRSVRFGDASSAQVLARAAHAERARMLVLVLSDAEAARRAALLAKARWPHLWVLARVRRASAAENELATHGVEVISEEWETVLVLVDRVLRRRPDRGGEGRRGLGVWLPESQPLPARLPDVAVDPLVVRAGDRLAGRTLEASGLREHTGAAVVAISRGATVRTDPPDDTEVEPGDIVLLLGPQSEVARARAWIRREQGAEVP